MPEVSIAASFKDNLSAGLKKVTEVTRSFSNDLEGLQKRIDVLNRDKVNIKTDLDRAKKEARAAEQQLGGLNDALAKSTIEAANLKAQHLADEYAIITKGIRETTREMEKLTTAQNKQNNRGAGGGRGTFFDDATSAIFKVQAVNAAVDFGVNLGNYIIGSAFGNEAANVAGGALSGAASGALAGFTIGGPAGAAIGGFIGAAGGALNGIVQNAQSKDDFFKSVVQDKYSESKQMREEALARGSETAAGREIDEISFSTLIGPEYNDYLKWVTKTGATTPFEYGDLTALSKTLATYGYSADEMKDMLIKIGDTGSNLGLDASGMSMVATGLGRMKSSNKTTLEYLNLLLERGIPVIDYLSDGLQKSKGQIYDMISKGLIPGAEAAKIIADKMGEANSGAMETMSHTFSGLSSTIEDFWTNAEAAEGKAYNSVRKEALEDTVDWSNKVSENMEKAYGAMGLVEAKMQNIQDRLLQKEYDEIFNSDAFKIVMTIPDGVTEAELTDEQLKAAAEVQEQMATAKAKAEAEYFKGDGYELKKQTEIDIVRQLQKDVSGSWYNYGYNLQLELNNGRVAAGVVTTSDYAENAANMGRPNASGNNQRNYGLIQGASMGAFGFPTVPYDNYPAILHQGEMVLTASQARAYKGAKSGGVVVTGNSFTVREEADINRIASQLARLITEAREGYIYA